MTHNRNTARAGFALAAFFLAAALTAAGTPSALADGMMLPIWDRELYESAQVAFLRLDAEQGIQHMTIMPKIRGEATDFAWVVPVPALPELAEADPDLLNQLHDLTQPRYRDRDEFWNCNREELVLPTTDSGDAVVVVAEQIVGIFQTMTLAAEDAGTLVDSLTYWGFLHDGNRTEVTALLDAYVQEDWYFVAMRVDSTAFPQAKGAASPTPPEYFQPAVQPVTFSFAADALIYPLRISAVSTYGDAEVYLYICAEHRMTFPGAETLYANRLTAAEMRAVRASYPLAGDLLAEGDFLTKLHRGYNAQQMTADIVPEHAPDDSEYLPIRYSGLPVWTLVFVGTIGGYWIRRRRRRPAGRT